ncbi:transporter [Shewanella phaeophyticola]|uniref:Transporter n=1 Tax=Shewanella phaeophyticola TaxID=2978345 RepID=A0ABT2P5A5_9GAMM|nr:transporter [Shewanella sp. KJ10-1]MCT8987637.1 transporter [Shewanella sp. KJ10-1]
MKKNTNLLSGGTYSTAVGLILINLMAAQYANAGYVPLAFIGLHDYDLPVNFEPFNAIVEYAYVQNTNERFDSNGDKVDTSSLTEVASFTKYAHFFTVDALPDVGLGFEFVPTFVSVEGDEIRVSGIGDPLVGIAGWMKPNENSTLGIQSYISIPVGDNDVSANNWGSFTQLFAAYKIDKISLDAHLGAMFRTTTRVTGEPNIDAGNTYHASVRVAYRVNDIFEPFIGANYQNTKKSTYENSGTTVDILNSNSNEVTLGAGTMAYLSSNMHASLWYDVGLDGENTSVTNAIFARFSYVW